MIGAIGRNILGIDERRYAGFMRFFENDAMDSKVPVRDLWIS